jgi:hypothetical protein
MAGDIKNKINNPQIAKAWADITIKVWRERLVKVGAVRTNHLWQSFVRDVIEQANGDIAKITFAFKYYGKFVDMGVGRGTRIGGVRDNASSRKIVGKMLGNRRKPKKWYSKTLAHEVMRLSEIMGKSYADGTGAIIKEGLEQNQADNSIKGGATIKL